MGICTQGNNVIINTEEQDFLSTQYHWMLYFSLEHIAAGITKKNPLPHFSSEEYKPGNTEHM